MWIHWIVDDKYSISKTIFPKALKGKKLETEQIHSALRAWKLLKVLIRG